MASVAAASSTTEQKSKLFQGDCSLVEKSALASRPLKCVPSPRRDPGRAASVPYLSAAVLSLEFAQVFTDSHKHEMRI